MKRQQIIVKALEATVRRIGGQILPGGFILNPVEGTPPIWINRNELQNALSRQEMAPNIPCSDLKGAVLDLELHEFSQADIDKAIADGQQAPNTRGEMTKGYVIKINGRDVVFTQPGVKYVLKSIDLANCDFSEQTINKIRVSAAVYDMTASRTKSRVAAIAPTTPTVPPVNKETVLEGPASAPLLPGGGKTEVTMPDILKGVKQDAAKNYINEDGSPLSEEQEEAMSLWVQEAAAL